MAVTFGTAKVFNSAKSRFNSVVALTSTTAVIAYSDDTSGDQITKVATISGTDVTFGVAKVAKVNLISHLETVKLTSSTFLIVGNGGWSKVGTVSGTTITYGTEASFSASSAFQRMELLTTDKVILTFRGPSGNPGNATVGTISGTDVTWGTTAEWISAAGGSSNDVIVLDTTHFVICYRDLLDSSHGTAKIGTVSGTTITYGIEYEFLVGTATFVSASALSSTKFMVVYSNGTSSNHGAAKIGTVSGATITFGTEFEWLSANGSGNIFSQYSAILTSGQVLVSYRDQSDLNHGTMRVATISGTTITYEPEVEFLSSDGVDQIGFDQISDDVGLVTYEDQSNISFGTARVVSGLSAPSATLLLAPPNRQANLNIGIRRGMQ